MQRKVFSVSTQFGNLIIVPTLNKIFLQDEKLLVPEFLEDDEPGQEKDIFNVQQKDFYSVMFFPTNKCNLRCIYCYANSCEKGVFISVDIAKAAIDLVFKNCKKDNHLAWVRFHGGGEPTLAWKQLVAIVNYAKSEAKNMGLKLKLSITTNGFINDEQRRFLSVNMDYINLSFDGPKEVQNLQRPTTANGESFTTVFNTAKFFYNSGVKFGVRASITRYSVKKMNDIVNFFADNFPGISVAMEPIDIAGRCLESGLDSYELIDFPKLISEANFLAKQRCIKLNYSALELRFVGLNYCGTSLYNFIVTPEGYVTACSRVCRTTDPGAELFIYGYFDKKSKKFVFDQDKRNLLQSVNVNNMPDCKDCFAAWLCKGDCPMTRYSFNKDVFSGVSPRCEDRKRLIVEYLLRRLDVSPPTD